MAQTIRGLFNDTTLTNLTVPGTESEARLTPGHAIHVNLRNQAGTEMGTVANPLIVTSSGGGGGGGVSVIDGSPFVVDVSSFAPTGGVFNDAVAPLTSGDQGESRVTANRALHVNLRNAAGAEMLGQQLMTGSIPVVIASNQSKIGVNLNDGAGNAIGSVAGAINVNIASGGGSGFSVPDGTAWTAGATALVPTGGVFNDAAAALSAGNEGTVRMTANRGFHVSLRTQAGVELLGQQVMAGSIPVVIASNQSAVTITGAVTVTGTVTTTPPANASTNIAQYGGVATSLGQKVAASSIPVVLASDQGAQTVTGTVTANQGGAPWSNNITQFGGVAVAVNNGTANTGTQRVAIASDNTPFTVNVQQATAASLNAQVEGDVASGAADAGNPVKIGGTARTTTLPTAVTSAQRVNGFFDSIGRQVMTTAPRLLKLDQQTTLTTTTETTILAAVVGTFMDLCMLVITNSSATATTVTIRSGTGGTIKMIVDIAANGGAVIPLNTPLIHATANTPWTAQLGTAVTSIHIMAQAISNVN